MILSLTKFAMQSATCVGVLWSGDDGMVGWKEGGGIVGAVSDCGQDGCVTGVAKNSANFVPESLFYF